MKMANRLHIANIYVQNGRLAPIASYEELVKLDRADLRAIAKRIFENANRRMANIRANGLATFSETLQSIQKVYGRAFRARGKTDAELVQAIRAAHMFMTQPDSTVRAVKQIAKDVQKATPNLTPGETREVYRIYGRLHRDYPQFFEKLRQNNYSSNQIRQYVVDVVKNERRNIMGGIAGDLFSKDKKEIKATAAERESAIKKAMAQAEKYIEQEEKRLNRQIKIGAEYKPVKFSMKDAPKFKLVKVEVEPLK